MVRISSDRENPQIAGKLPGEAAIEALPRRQGVSASPFFDRERAIGFRVLVGSNQIQPAVSIHVANL
jgi:hypothetical protein